jgi:hypothetical protein
MHTFPMTIRGRIPSLASMVLCATFSMIAANATFAAESTSVQRFELSGSGTLVLDQPVQKNANLRLKAYMTPKDAVAAIAPVQEGSGFALIASVSNAQSVCYNDTIFRDDFDGDGF